MFQVSPRSCPWQGSASTTIRAWPPGPTQAVITVLAVGDEVTGSPCVASATPATSANVAATAAATWNVVRLIEFPPEWI
jgi:hypothetical protein